MLFSRGSPWPALALVLGLTLLSGCGGNTLPPAADPDQARAALRTALDAWQQGESVEALNQRNPPIYVADDDWQAGRSLVKYEVTGEGEMFGLNFCCPVRISLKDQNGKTVEKKVHYTIGTQPALTIFREDRRRDS